MRLSTKKVLAAAAIFSTVTLGSGTASAQECMIGEIRMFGGNFAPRNWAFTHGQLLPISQNQALFSILGTTYGGDGRTTFGLPDMRGRVSMGAGQGPGLSNYSLGEKGGSEDTGNNALPAVKKPGINLGNKPFPPNLDPTSPSSPAASPEPNKKSDDGRPYQVVNYIMCMSGIYPSRS